jgi:Glycosyltransferase 61
MNIVSFKDLVVFKNVFQRDENNRQIDIYKLENTCLTGNNLYYPNALIKINGTDKRLVLPLLERTMSLKTGSIYEKTNMMFEYKPRTHCGICHDPLFFFLYNTDNYFHFLYDSIPYLISYFELKKEIPNLKLLMQYPNEQQNTFYPFINEFLDILHVTADDIVMVDVDTIYNTIYVSTSYTHDIDSNLPPRKEIYGFYQTIVKTVKDKFSPLRETPKKIYVSRRTWLHNDFSNIGTNYTTRRRLVNEDELVEQLTRDGFVEVFTEKLSTIDKILYFASATHVVGAIGGGVSNVLFSPNTTKLEVLVSPTFLDVNTRFKYSLDCVDVTYNTNTHHVETGNFKTYMRVKSKDGTFIGEIEKVYDTKLLISYTNGSNTGWNAQIKYDQIEVNMRDVDKLDDGLNSPWQVNIIKL